MRLLLDERPTPSDVDGSLSATAMNGLLAEPSADAAPNDRSPVLLVSAANRLSNEEPANSLDTEGTYILEVVSENAGAFPELSTANPANVPGSVRDLGKATLSSEGHLGADIGETRQNIP